MPALIKYAQDRYFQKSRGWGRTWVRWLWLDAALFATARWLTLHSPLFRRWCREVDRLFVAQFDWPRAMTTDTGFDCWIDPYWEGLSPQDAVDSEVENWEP